MNHVYVLSDKTGYVVGATYEEPKAMQICKEEQGWFYRIVPFYSLEGTKIEVTAGPINDTILKNKTTKGINRMDKPTDIITEKQIDIAWGNANFGNDRNVIDRYKLIANGILKCASGYSTGHTMQCILEDLGLVLHTWELSPRGKRFLYAAYNDGISV